MTLGMEFVLGSLSHCLRLLCGLFVCKIVIPYVVGSTPRLKMLGAASSKSQEAKGS
jgi:hypothetical protein